MAEHVQYGDKLHAERVICTYRKVHKPTLLPKTGTHRGKRVKLEGDVECVIDKVLRISSESTCCLRSKHLSFARPLTSARIGSGTTKDKDWVYQRRTITLPTEKLSENREATIKILIEECGYTREMAIHQVHQQFKKCTSSYSALA